MNFLPLAFVLGLPTGRERIGQIPHRIGNSKVNRRGRNWRQRRGGRSGLGGSSGSRRFCLLPFALQNEDSGNEQDHEGDR